MQISLRNIRNDDFEFLWELQNAALRSYVDATWGWDEDWQREHFTGRFDTSRGKIITVDGVDAGFWWVIEHEDDILLGSVHLLPEFHNRGIGTRMIRELLDSTDKPVRLQVLKVNPARALYERLGFHVVDENETHYKMINPGPR